MNSQCQNSITIAMIIHGRFKCGSDVHLQMKSAAHSNNILNCLLRTTTLDGDVCFKRRECAGRMEQTLLI